MKALAKVMLKFDDRGAAKALFKALKPESLKPPTQRSKATATLRGNFLS